MTMETYNRRVVARRDLSQIEVALELECGHLVNVFPGNEEPDIAHCIWCERERLPDGESNGAGSDAAGDAVGDAGDGSAARPRSPRWKGRSGRR